MNSVIKLLSAKEILFEIQQQNKLCLKKLEIFDEIPSTNGYLLKHADSGESGWVCLAEQRTQGYGRQGKKWFSTPGSSVLCSLLWRVSDLNINFSALSMAVAVMLVNALEKYGVSGEGIQIKWPNDILFAGRKLAGILLERKNKNIVIGIGLNVDIKKIDINIDINKNINLINLAEITQKKIDRNKIAGLLLNELLSGLAVYEQVGLANFIDSWRERDYLSGKKVVVSLPDKIIRGEAQGLNQAGELFVLDEDGTALKLTYGEVSVRVP